MGPDDQPVARLKVEPFRGLGDVDVFHYLYPGINVIGSDPKVSDIVIDQPHLIANGHLQIDCHDDDIIYIMDTRKLNLNRPIIPSILREKVKMQSKRFYEFTPTQKVKISGLVTCELVEFTPNKEEDTRRCVIRPTFSSSQECRQLSDSDTRDQVVFCVPNHPSRGETKGKLHNDGQIHQVPENQSDIFEDSLASTQTIEELTVSIRDDFGSLSGADSNASQASINSNLEINNNAPEGPPAPAGDPTLDAANFSGGVNSDAPAHTQHVDPDAPTQLADLDAPTQLADSDAPTQLVDPDAPTQLADPDALTHLIDPDAPTQVLDPNETQIYEDTQSVPSDDGNLSSQETQSPQRIASSLEIALEGAVADEPGISDSQQERVCQTQPTQSEDARTTQSLPHSRQTSVEPISQEVSQVISANSSENNPLYVPATPVDMINDDHSGEKPGKANEQTIEEGKSVGTPSRSGDLTLNNNVLDRRALVKSLRSGDSQTAAGHIISNEDKESVRTSQQGPGDVQVTYSDEEAVKQPYRRQSRPILTDSQEPASSSPQVCESSRSGLGAGFEQNKNQDSTSPPNQTPTVSRGGSPKHGIDSDSEEHSRKPTKLVKTESTEGVVAITQGRAAPSRLSRRSTMDSEQKAVMISGSSPEARQQWKQMIEKFGGSYKENHKDGNILVVDATVRTLKFMSAIVRGIPIVTLKWLKDSKTNHKFMPYEEYYYHDEEFESRYGLKFSELSRKPDEHQIPRTALFKDYSFYFVTAKGKKNDPVEQGHITREAVTSNLAPLVELCGGKVLKGEPKTPSAACLVIGPDVYCATTQRFIKNQFQVVRTEFIMNAILKQELSVAGHRIGPQEPDEVYENMVVDDGNEEDVESEYDDCDASFSKSTASNKTRAKGSKTPSMVSRSQSSVSATGSVFSRRGSDDSITTSSNAGGAGSRRASSTSARTKGAADDSESMSEATVSSSRARTKISKTKRETKGKGSAGDLAEQVQPRKTLGRKQSKGSSSSIKISATDTEESDVSAAPSVSSGSNSKPKRSSSTSQTPKRSSRK
ncbi:Mediator of DNA damage checkpoint protein 1 [Mortierella sp. AD011]|nr:Mediator of DNA damage checkpoint protein 1 [Mortierella sp. AD011]